MSAYISGNLAYKYREQEVQTNNTKKASSKMTMPKGEKLFYLFSVIFIVFLSSVIISGYAEIAEYNYEIQKTEKSITELSEQSENLQRKIAELSAPERILKIAQDELGMTLNESQIVVLNNR